MAICIFALNANAFSLNKWMDETTEKLKAYNESLKKEREASQTNSQVQQSEPKDQNQVQQPVEEIKQPKSVKEDVKPQEPVFKSLAEEKAYRKQQELLEKQNKEQEVKNIIEKHNQLREEFQVKKYKFYDMYLVKVTDTEEMIDKKYQNSDKLFRKMLEDYKSLMNEYEIIKNYNSRIYKLSFESMDEIKNTDKPDGNYDADGYNKYKSNPYFHHIERCYQGDEDCFSYIPSYQKYLKEAYETYAEWQPKMIKDSYFEKERKFWEPLGFYTNDDIEKAIAKYKTPENYKKMQAEGNEKEKKERARVKKSCEVWEAKAHKQTYSLGVGDKVIGNNNFNYIILGSNANTFVVRIDSDLSTGKQYYLDKSMAIPSKARDNAPSPYCYK
jgi:hypothetical protein